ncbi:Trm112 family protein [Streptomyces aureoverticillatus]|uniref:Trm112 family protein n=1 Tax=Streptomyces aureoverticillatus TaxID=66871 RepID=UPI0013DB7628|nr:Trm112 family protein [Streptomyces aureoverticillatus]QIB45982.1 Trm112 family protein [Streptomyces aureoverticillatus]
MNAEDPLLKILACPLDKGPLVLLEPDEVLLDEAAEADGAGEADGAEPAPAPEQSLYNPRLHRRYPIVDGIPQLLPSSGEQVTEDEHERLLKRTST